MFIFGILMAGLAVGAMVGAFDSNESDEDSATNGALVEGDEEENTLIGTSGHDLLSGMGDSDDLTGKDGNDILLGGEGDDLLKGRAGIDFLEGGDGNDDLRGGQDGDLLFGLGGDDTLMGGEGDDVLVGANISNRDSTVDDFLFDGGDPTLPTQAYQAPEESEANMLFGEEGNDTLILGEGDTGTGGQGDDWFQIAEWVNDENNVPHVTDFDEEDDVLAVGVATGTTHPVITLDLIDDVRHVYADGQLVAQVQGDGGPFFASDVRIIEVG